MSTELTASRRFPSHPSLSPRNRAGLLLIAGLGLMSLLSVFQQPGGQSADGTPTGPPLPILILGAILGLLMLAACVHAWRSGSRRSVRLAVGLAIFNTLTAIPGFTADIEAWVKVVIALVVVVTFAAVVLVLSPGRAGPGSAR